MRHHDDSCPCWSLPPGELMPVGPALEAHNLRIFADRCGALWPADAVQVIEDLESRWPGWRVWYDTEALAYRACWRSQWHGAPEVYATSSDGLQAVIQQAAQPGAWL